MLKANRLLIIIASLLFVFSMVSCGGGGDGGNTAPVANAGPDQNVATDSLVTLDGGGSSDADGDPLTYNWSFTSKPAGSTAALSDSTVVNPTFTADVDGAYVVSLVVNDGTVDSAADTVTITITAASVINLPETGQTTPYATGDDGEIQAGVEWPSPRFTDNRDGTVTDNLTGLIWLQDANCFGARTWTQALSDANSLASGSCSLTDGSAAGDWRLSNVNELESLINAKEVSTATWLNAQGFTNVQSVVYWSSTTYAFSTDGAWVVRMCVGGVRSGSKADADSGYVWPVRAETTQPVQLPETGQTTSYAIGDDGDLRAGVEWPSPRFVVDDCETLADTSDDVVTDNLTGLMWARDGNLDVAKTWADALTYANGLSLCVYDDWRLPNRKELRSLINYGAPDTATWLSGQGFSNVQSDYYWSSTTRADGTGSAWGVNMYGGRVGSGSKADSYYVWPVRAGQ